MSLPASASIARRVEALWYGNSPVTLLLLPFAWLFGLVGGLRRFAYRAGWLQQHRCGVPVVIVGNITVGGTGKTPLVGWIADRLAADGRRVGILSRGYGGSAAHEPRFVTRDSDPRDVGDEALLLVTQTSAVVCVCADRFAGAQRLVAEGGVDIIVCDDGLQHYRLGRDAEIAVIDGARGFGNGRLLPAGPLREPRERLADVDIVFVNGATEAIDACRFDLRPTRVVSLDRSRQAGLDAFAGQRVWCVAGIGNPARFAATLSGAGIDPEFVDVPDHGAVSLEALRAAEPWPILMTEKDAVKYPASAVADAWFVAVDVEISPPDEAALMKILRKLYVDTR